MQQPQPDEVEDREVGPQPLGEFLAERVERIRRQDAAGPGLQIQSNAVESEEERRQRVARQRGRRADRWGQRLPKLYAQASMAGLGADQHPERLQGWLGSRGQLTLFLAGNPGTGKTFAAYAVAQAAVAQGLWVEAWNTVELLDALLPGTEAPFTWSSVLECDLLLLDDLGAPKVTDWALQAIYRIADKRVNEERRQIVTTNGSFAELVEKWGGPTVDRLSFRSTSVVLTGESRRKAAW